jgi:hypothetical protein
MIKQLQILQFFLVLFLPVLAHSQSSNVRLVKDFNPGEGSSFTNSEIIGHLGDVIFITLKKSDADPYEVWRSDGTESGTFRLIGTSSTWSNIVDGFYKSGETKAFIEVGDALYVTDGTVAGTTIVDNNFSGDNPRVINNALVYSQSEEIKSRSLSGNVSVIYKNESFQSFEDFFIDGNYIWYTAQKDFDNDSSFLFRYDVVKQTLTELIGMDEAFYRGPWYFEKLPGGKIVYLFKGQENTSLYSTDGTPEGTIKIKDFDDSFAYGLSGAYQFNGKYYFNGILLATDPEYRNLELFVSDGTVNGTKSLYSEQTKFRQPEQIVYYKGQVYFSAAGEDFYQSIFKTDGTPQGTVKVDLPVSNFSDLELVASASDLVFIGNDTRNNTYGILTSGGTMVSTRSYAADLSQEAFYVTPNKIFFSGYTEETGRELYEFVPSVVSALNDNEIKVSELICFPNPAHDYVSVKGEGEISADAFAVDLAGRKFRLQSAGNRLDVSQLESGYYILEFESDSQKKYSGIFKK